MADVPQSRPARDGRLVARPDAVAPASEVPPGTHRLGLAAQRDGLLHVPRAGAGAPRPLVVLLHGAGADADDILPVLAPAAEREGILVLAPDSRGDTWDLLQGGIGHDVAYLDAALAHAFARVRVDATRVALGGFSDGASYALSLGLANGDLFSHVLAFSPGFAAPPAQVGRPALFVSHGRGDAVLRIEPCSRRLVPVLERAGYAVAYVEFDGGHTVPPRIADDAVAWMLDRG